MGPQLTIFRKGLILVVVPCVIQLLFLALVARMQAHQHEDQRASLHSKDVLNQAQKVHTLLVDADSGLRGFLLTGDRLFSGTLDQADNELLPALARLRTLVSDNPHQAARVALMFAKSEVFLKSRAEQRQLVPEGGLADAVARGRLLEGKVQTDELRRELDTFMADERRLDLSRAEELAQTQAHLYRLLWIGTAASLAGMGLLALAFNRGINERLAELMRNTRRLAQGEELPPGAGGGDEIARIDAAVRDMAQALAKSSTLARRAEERFRNIFFQAPVPMMLHAEGGAIVLVNESWTELSGYTLDEMLTIADLTGKVTKPDPERLHKGLQALYRETDKSRQGEYDVITRGGQARTWDFSSAPLGEVEDGRRIVLTMGVDVTQRNLAVRELEVINQELESFSYSVSHDLRAPLRSIDGFSELLQRGYGDRLDDQGRDFLRRVRAAAQRMGQLIDDLLNLSRVTRRQMKVETVDLSALAHTIVGDLRHAEPARDVEVTIAEDLKVQGDEHLLRVALENLLGNAWKYTSKRPHAKIEFGTDEQDRQRVFVVKDDGAGFDQAHAGKLFGAFQRLHRIDEFPGTGIGLATVQRIIHRHGGRIWAQAQVDRGAAFSFTLA